MRAAGFFATPIPTLAVGAGAVSASYFAAGPSAALGMALGLAATGFDVVALWLAIKIGAKAAVQGGSAGRYAGFVVLAFLLKLPLFVAAVYAAKRIGAWAQFAFGIAIILVYFLLVAWSLCKGRAPTE